jgi:hypothetical protein
MPELSPIDPWSAALLVMGYQVDTLIRFMTPAQSADAIACVPDLIAMARGAGRGHDGDSCRWRIVGAFRPGHPGVVDYRLVVVRDCCADPDAQVHAMLRDSVIAKQAAVVTTAELAGALPGRSS